MRKLERTKRGKKKSDKEKKKGRKITEYYNGPMVKFKKGRACN